MKKISILANSIRAFINYRKKRTVLNNAPSYIWLEPTNHCNLRCVMCPNGAGKVTVDKGYMDYDLFTRIIDQISPHTSALTLAVGGESLLHPRFVDMVHYSKSKGMKVLLNTNATLLYDGLSGELLDAELDYISFAFDGFTRESYEKARRGAKFNDTLGNINAFLRLKRSKRAKKPYCVLSVLNLGLGGCSESDKQRFIARLDEGIDEIRQREVASWGSTFKDETSFAHRAHEGVYPPCSRLWSTTCISWNGEVVPCIYNANREYVLGSLERELLLDIWNGEAMIGLREAMLDGSYLERSPLCENCIVLGTPPLLGVPSGLRLSMADALVNFAGFGLEKFMLQFANKIRKNKFTTLTIKG
ncbi:MAG: radical SAM protein [Proteobacteria bacterium]|nr:radical SAM protein [Pseudomonadota bacterium]MBU4296675.1 radical SAM protein [Pseudomonadota bacterium]MCG2748468.1 radical SAM protein [Desulfobulbaceae bacterium]